MLPNICSVSEFDQASEALAAMHSATRMPSTPLNAAGRKTGKIQTIIDNYYWIR